MAGSWISTCSAETSILHNIDYRIYGCSFATLRIVLNPAAGFALFHIALVRQTAQFDAALRMSRTVTTTAVKTSPDRRRGLARDMRVRSALKEFGLPCDVRLVTFAKMKQPPHLMNESWYACRSPRRGCATVWPPCSGG